MECIEEFVCRKCGNLMKLDTENSLRVIFQDRKCQCIEKTNNLVNKILLTEEGSKRHDKMSLQHDRTVMDNTAKDIVTDADGPIHLCGDLGYSSTVVDKLYPVSLISSVQHSQESYIISIQVRSAKDVYCLLCKNIDSLKNIITHVKGKRHRKNLANADHCNFVNAYHNYWIKVTAEYQIMQKNFIPVDCVRTWCCICNENVLYCVLEEHLKGNCQINKQVSTQAENVATTEKCSSKIVSTNIKLKSIDTDQAVQIDMSSQIPSNTFNIKAETAENLLQFTEESASSDTSGESEYEHHYKIDEESESDIVSFRNPSDDVESINNLTGCSNMNRDNINFQFKFEMKYDRSVEDELYPEKLRKYFVLINDIKYPIIRVNKSDFTCLICGTKCDAILTSPGDHVRSVSHNNEMKSFALSDLKKFHGFWMNQEPPLQLEQVHFNIQAKNLECVLCDLNVSYEELLQHTDSYQHKKFTRNPINRKKDIKGVPNGNTSHQDLNCSDVSEPSPLSAGESSPAKKQIEHEVRKSVLNPDSSVMLERLPSRFQDSVPLLRIDSNTSVFCRCCSVTIQHTLCDIKLHLGMKDHLAKAKLPFKKFKFFCEICVKIYSSDASWEKHMKENDHLAVLNNLGKVRRDNMTEYECVTCTLVIFGDKLSLLRHKKWNKLSKKSREIKLPEDVRKLFQSNIHIEKIASEMMIEANQESQDQEREKKCCVALVSALKEIYQQCRAYPFGSRVTGLGSKDSDLDVFIDVNNMYAGNELQSSEDQAIIITNVTKILKKSKKIFSHINPVPTARTPIVQVYHIPTGIDCDVSFRHGLSVENTAFIRLCIDLQPVIQKVILILKKWCSLCSLNNFSSYALTMLAIFYFQTQGYLLSVKLIKAINPTYLIIDGWETVKYSVPLATMRNHIKSCELNVKELLYDFFTYYTTFDYDKFVMCPLLGHTVFKTCFNDNGAKLPPEMISYTKKLSTYPDSEQFRNRPPMCIQDPFDLSHNLTKACEKGFLTKWKKFCELSATHLKGLN